MSKAYFDYDGLSYSQMKDLLVSPAHYRLTMERRKTELPSDALRFGSAFDAMVFNRPSEIKIWTETKTMQSIAAEKFRRANPDVICVTEDEHRRLLEMRKAVMTGPAGRFIELSDHQVEFYGKEDTAHGEIQVKAMVDGLADKLLWDLKTTSFSAMDFPYHARKLRYPMQGAWYRHRASMHDDKLRDFYFVVVETQPPFGVKVWQLSDETLQKGQDDFRAACEIYAKCRAENSWPVYDSDVIGVF